MKQPLFSWVPLALSLAARAAEPAEREIHLDLSVGSDYPGTLIRDDSQRLP